MSLKDKIKNKIEKKIKKIFKILPEYDQKKRLCYYKSIGINFDRVLDIGAYIGSWKEMFQTIYPNADILMIEGNREKEEILKKKGKYLIALLGSENEKIVYNVIIDDYENHLFADRMQRLFEGDGWELSSVDDISAIVKDINQKVLMC